jgi:hypothetical protein
VSFLIAGTLAGGIAYLVNRQVVQRMGPVAISSVIPVVEEVLKTGLAIILGASILGTHFIFGIIEGIYDYLTGGKGKTWAGVISVVSHFVFGLVTLTVSGSLGILPAVVLSTTIHAGWNAIIIKIADHRLPRKLS